MRDLDTQNQISIASGPGTDPRAAESDLDILDIISTCLTIGEPGDVMGDIVDAAFDKQRPLFYSINDGTGKLPSSTTIPFLTNKSPAEPTFLFHQA